MHDTSAWIVKWWGGVEQGQFEPCMVSLPQNMVTTSWWAIQQWLHHLGAVPHTFFKFSLQRTGVRLYVGYSLNLATITEIIGGLPNLLRHWGSVTVAQWNRKNTWDGTGCEFDSWQCRISIISHVHRAYDYSSPFGVSLGTYGLIQKLCWWGRQALPRPLYKNGWGVTHWRQGRSDPGCRVSRIIY